MVNIYSTITAPIAFAILAIEKLLCVILNVIGFLISALTLDVDGAIESSLNVMECTVDALLNTIVAVVSPVVNFVDLVVSGVNTLADVCSSDGDLAAVRLAL